MFIIRNINIFSYSKQATRVILLLPVLMLLLSSCDFIRFSKETKPEAPYAARVYDKYLYLSELQNKIPGNMSPEDSIFWTRNFINLWVQEQLFLHQAINNLPPKEQDFTPQLEAYKNSLLQYAYEARLIEQNLDTIITNSETEQYYNEHLADFILSRNIVKPLYVGIWIDSIKMIKDFKKLSAAKPFSLEDIEYFCDDMVLPYYYLDTTKWVYFDDVLKVTPIQTDNQGYWLVNNQAKEFSNDRYWYYIFISDYRLKNDFAPLDIERDRVQKIILVRRKEALLKDLKRSIFEDAQQKGAFEIF